MVNKQLEADFDYCEAVIKKHSKSFYYAFSNLPLEKSRAVYAIYAFCRISDDSVDENYTLTSKQVALNKLRNELQLFKQGREVNHPIWRALRHVFETYEMDIQPFFDQLDGQKMDIQFSSPETLLDLEKYSYYVAGSVGLMLLPIIASENKSKLNKAAIQLGVAMQLTNILRDIGEDYFEKKRIYLPRQERRQFAYSETKLRNGIIDRSFIELWENIANRAEDLYDEFHGAIDLFDQDSQLPVAISANVYRGILDVIRENDYDCITKRNFVNREQMMSIRA